MNFINSELMRNAVYHNHKENMAWVATALYISGAFILGFNLDCAIDWQKATTIFGAIVITLLTFLFVDWQFDKRSIAVSRGKRLLEIAKEELVKDNSDKLSCYLELVTKYESDPKETRNISLSAMGIAFIAFIMLVFC